MPCRWQAFSTKRRHRWLRRVMGDDPDELSLPKSAPRLHRPVAVLCRECFRCGKAEECADALGAVFRGFELGEDAPSEGGCCRQFRFVQGAYGGVGRFFHVYAYKATAAGNRSGRRCVWCLPVLERQVVHFCRGRGKGGLFGHRGHVGHRGGGCGLLGLDAPCADVGVPAGRCIRAIRC